jgi:eukaryotic-like serine/threonine-protein kinase
MLLEECGEDVTLREQVVSLLLASSNDGGEFEQRYEAAVVNLLRGSDVPTGAIIGRYRVQRLLGRGGMGAVYLAERADEQYQQTVALKLVSRSVLHEATSGRFRGERQILARLNHPNIARLLDGGHTDDGTPYFVMEYVEGLRIDLYGKEHSLSSAARLRLVQQVCSAVQYAHQNLIVHRDLKPSNILVTGDGTPKLLDFGIAKLLDPGTTGAPSEHTRARDRIMTPEHASPEQLRGEPVGTVSDVYSLGVLLYELLTGFKPYSDSGLSFAEIERAVCEKDPIAPSARVRALARESDPPAAPGFARKLAGDLDNIVLKAMQREPQRRYPSAAALSEDIANYLHRRPVQARPNTLSYRAGKYLRRNGLAVASAAGVAVLIGVLIAFYTVRLATERDTALRERQTAAGVADFMVDVFRLANPSESQGNTVTVRQALDAAQTRIEHDLAQQPRLRLILMRNMAQAYSGLGLWTQARTLLERTIAQERAAFGGHQIELARTLAALGTVDDNLNQYEAAQSALAEAWSIHRALGQERTAEAILLLNAIAGDLRLQQQFTQAEQYHRQAEESARALVPAQPQTLGQVLLGYGMTYSESGDYRRAEAYAREALPLVHGVVYQGIDLYANALATLATALRRQYRLPEAEKLHREFLQQQIRRLGPDGVLVGRGWNNLANVLRAEGHYREAEEAYDQALRIYRIQGGPADTLDVAIAFHNIGALLHDAGDLPRSLEELDAALVMKRKVTGEQSAQTVSTLTEKSAVLRDMGRLDEARRVLDEARATAAQKLDPNDRRQAAILAERGRLELATGDLSAADRDLRSVVGTMQGQEDPGRLADAMASLGEALVSEGNLLEARSVFRQTLALRSKIFPSEHWAVADAQSRLGEMLVLAGEPEQGHALLSQSLAQLQLTRPGRDVVLLAAEKRMADHPRITTVAMPAGQ